MKDGKKLYRSDKNKMLFGVCGGFAEFFGIDVTIVRVIAVVLALLKGFGVIAYIILAVIMPNGLGKVDSDENVDNLKSANISEEEFKSSKKSKSKKNKGEAEPHTDEEFDSYFKSEK